jgi:uncharacterized protein
VSLRVPLALWTSLILTFAALSYGERFSQGPPADDTLYRWSFVAAGLLQFAIIGALVYAIAGLGNRRDLFALRRPTSWRLAAAIAVGIAIAMILLLRFLAPLLHPGEEQGLTPDVWDPHRAAPYVANGLVIALAAPVVEELTFRGLGYSLLARFGRWTAIVLIGVLFALAHGLVEAFPFLAALGAMLAYLRSRVDSVYPGMIVHALFNATALVVSVAA